MVGIVAPELVRTVLQLFAVPLLLGAFVPSTAGAYRGVGVATSAVVAIGRMRGYQARYETFGDRRDIDAARRRSRAGPRTRTCPAVVPETLPPPVPSPTGTPTTGRTHQQDYPVENVLLALLAYRRGVPPELGVRRYRPPDAAAVWAVHEAAFRASPLPFVEDAPADADLRAIVTEYLDGGEFVVGELCDEVVAVGGFQPVDGCTVEIRRMRVHPEYQRRGFGRQILRSLEERARDRGFQRAALETVDRLEAALSLYREAGYEVVERRDHPVTGDELVSLETEL